jgi:hypothetical protein
MSYEPTKTIRADEARRMFGASGEGIVGGAGCRHSSQSRPLKEA